MSKPELPDYDKSSAEVTRGRRKVTFIKTWKKKRLSKEWDEIARARATNPKITPIEDLETKKDFMIGTEVMVRTAEAAADLDKRTALMEFVDGTLAPEPDNVISIHLKDGAETSLEGRMFNRKDASFWRRDLVFFDLNEKV